jgi:hypothetical protein
MMAVVFIIGIIFLIGSSEISRAWKRQKLQSASGDIRALFQRAYSEVQRRGIPVFVQVGPLITAGASRYLPIYLVGDQTQDQILDCFQAVPSVACPDLLIEQYNIIVTGLSGTLGTTGVDQEYCLSDLDVTKVISTLWSDENPGPGSTDWAVKRAIMCDIQGRTMSVTLKAGKLTSSGRQIAAPATLVLTHVDVVNQQFQPPTRFILRVNPVWSVRVIKQIKDATSVWVDQNG